MPKDEQGFMDWLVEDICNTIEIKGAVEATRDENGKVDKWAATGLAMGLGHTSDDEMATLAGFLGAEGAFDDDDDTISNDYENIPASTVAPTFRASTTNCISETEYENKKKNIISEKRIITGMCIFALCLFTILLFSAMSSYPDGAAVYFLMILVIDSSLVYGIINTSKARERELSFIEQEYTESQKRRKQEEESKRKKEAAKKEYEALRNYAGTTNLCEAKKLMSQKAEKLFNEADKACNFDELTYNPGIIENLLTFIFYITINGLKITPKQKSATFFFSTNWCCVHSDFTGDMLFVEQQNDLSDTIQKALDETYTLITVAVHKSGQTGVDIDFTKTLCSLMILLGEEFDKQYGIREFGASGALVILETARRAEQRVIDERFLDNDSVDYDVNLPPIPITEPVQESALDEETQAVFKDMFSVLDDLEKIVSEDNGSTEEITTESDELFETDDEEEEFEDTFIGTNLIYADDMKLLSEAGYDEIDLELMEPEELKEAMEIAGVDTILYDFD